MRLTEPEYRVLSRRGEKTQTIHVPRGKPAKHRRGAGWVALVPCPVSPGRAYEAWAKVRANDGTIEKQTVTVTVIEVQELHDGEGWDVTVIYGDRTDKPRFMARTQSDPKTPGYVANPGRALDPEAPCVPEEVQRKWSEVAFERDEMIRAQRIAAARIASRGLREIGRDGVKAAREIEYRLDRLEGEQESEAA
jgi:hypothetical protein